MRVIQAQPGFQTKFLSSSADIVIGGGSAGGGKTFALLLDILRYFKVRDFGAVIFRRTTPQITNKGALWDTSAEIYNLIGGVPRQHTLDWKFPKWKSSVKFSHLEYEKNKYDWQGSQIPFIGFDELTHFTETQFFYLLGRNRSKIGIAPCVRAGCNPDPDSWVAEFLGWWIDQETGYPIPERDGVVRYFCRLEGNMIWGDSKKEIINNYSDTFKNLVKQSESSKAEDFIKSASFVRGDIYGNVELLKKDPAYLANLMALDEEEKQRLLHGNWKVRTDGMSLFQFDKIQDLFSNIIAEQEKPERMITCDVARFGRDLCVGVFWLGWMIKRIDILTKSDTAETIEMLEGLRKFGGVGKSNVLADQGGLGAGVVDVGNYKPFSANDAVLPDPATRIKENFDMLKTQCAYRIAEKVNRGQVAVDPQVEIYVDGVRTDKIKIGSKIIPVKKLLTDDLRTFRRADDPADAKKKIEPKDTQKAALGGRSPDLGDAFIMREWFELRPRVRIIV